MSPVTHPSSRVPQIVRDRYEPALKGISYSHSSPEKDSIEFASFSGEFGIFETLSGRADRSPLFALSATNIGELYVHFNYGYF